MGTSISTSILDITLKDYQQDRFITDKKCQFLPESSHKSYVGTKHSTFWTDPPLCIDGDLKRNLYEPDPQELTPQSDLNLHDMIHQKQANYFALPPLPVDYEDSVERPYNLPFNFGIHEKKKPAPKTGKKSKSEKETDKPADVSTKASSSKVEEEDHNSRPSAKSEGKDIVFNYERNMPVSSLPIDIVGAKPQMRVDGEVILLEKASE